MIRISIKPGASLQKRIDGLRRAAADVDADMSRAVRESAVAVVAGAKDKVPLSTGALRRSLQAIFLNNGLTAMVGSWLPYALKQDRDGTLDHSVRQNRIRVKNTIAGRVGSVIKGTGQFNPNAQAFFLEQALADEKPTFLAKLQTIVRGFGDAWRAA